MSILYYFFFFFNDTATTEIYTLSLHDALPISSSFPRRQWHEDLGLTVCAHGAAFAGTRVDIGTRALLRALAGAGPQDRKSTRLNSSHANISYAVFCLKKKKNKIYIISCIDNIL